MNWSRRPATTPQLTTGTSYARRSGLPAVSCYGPSSEQHRRLAPPESWLTSDVKAISSQKRRNGESRVMMVFRAANAAWALIDPHPWDFRNSLVNRWLAPARQRPRPAGAAARRAERPTRVLGTIRPDPGSSWSPRSRQLAA